MRLEVIAVFELRIVVCVGEVLHRHGLDPRRLQGFGDGEPGPQVQYFYLAGHVVSVHAAVAAYATAALNEEPVFEKRIWDTGPWASEADRLSVTAVTFVAAAPLFMTTVPVGG